MSHSPLRELAGILAASPQLHPVATRFAELGRTAVAQKDAVFPRPGSPTLCAADPLPFSVCAFGELDVSQILRQGAQNSREMDALVVLQIGGESLGWPQGIGDQAVLARRLLWLETYSGLCCLRAASLLLDSSHQQQIAQGLVAAMAGPSSPPLAESELRVAAAWLATHEDPQIAALATSAAQYRDNWGSPTLPSGHVLELAVATLRGELGSPSRGPIATTLLALTGILFVTSLWRTVVRFALRYRTPVSLALGPEGMNLEIHRELMGRTLTQSRWVVPFDQIREVVREVRFSRLGLVVGLGALAVGTYLGARLFVDGLRAPGVSLPLLGLGVLAVLLGLLLDFGLTTLDGAVGTRSRLIIRTLKGRAFAVSVPDREKVDALLDALASSIAAASR
jgi:hypothetical protein